MEWNPVCYLNSNVEPKVREKFRRRWQEQFPDGEVIETDVFSVAVIIDNSHWVVAHLKKLGREDLIRPLEREVKA